MSLLGNIPNEIDETDRRDQTNNGMSGRSAAWLARLPWEQEVGRSNRLAPTKYFGVIDSPHHLPMVCPPLSLKNFVQNVKEWEKNEYHPVKWKKM